MMSFFGVKVDIYDRYTAKSMSLNILCAFMCVIKCNRHAIVGVCVVECAVKSISITVNDKGSLCLPHLSSSSPSYCWMLLFYLIFALLNATSVDVKILLKQCSPQIASCCVSVSFWNDLILEF